MDEICSHIKNAKIPNPNTPKGCEECLKTSDKWFNLRLCLTCGHVGCCDESKNKHATKHYKKTKHPVIKSFERGENWKYCFIDDQTLE